MDFLLSILNIRIEFILFALILIGVAVFHNKTFWVALIGLSVILIYKLIFDNGFNTFEHFFGKDYSFFQQLTNKELRQGEWSILLNLFGLLLGFAVLARIFRDSGMPELITKFLPSDWKAPFILLVFVFILSAFLDNIAAAMIGGAIALVVFNNKVHVGYIAAIVAASNAGGAGSVLGDTTTTMMWIDGVSAFNVFHAYVAAIVAMLFFGWFASHQQHKYQHIRHRFKERHNIDWKKITIIIFILAGAIFGNVLFDMPAVGVWAAILTGITFTKIPWNEISNAIKGTIFLLCLVTCASLMPIETLPGASWVSAFIMGFASAVFDNIPLTKLCLEQGHFDWGMLAYTVGFGGSMLWFGSSAGVAITNEFPEARNVIEWIKKGWHVIVAYILGFFALYLLLGWEPSSNKKHAKPAINCKAEKCIVAEKAKNKSQK
ncbi:MAG: SLC13 family permease [Bacteroidales bacterium]|jgi:Na+/H+ antiporter NhaD/arsenite permease-like protein